MENILHRMATNEIERGESSGIRILDAKDRKTVDGRKVPHEGGHVALDLVDDGSLAFIAMFNGKAKKALVVKAPPRKGFFGKLVAFYQFHDAKYQAIRLVAEEEYKFANECTRWY